AACPSMSDAYTLLASDGAARAGVLCTAHGEVPTPAFMPVGTKATVKTVDPDELRSLGATILLGNTYHLYFRPGEDLIAELGGLHRFMGWDGPILTDSGGFQVFSLRDTLASVDDDGVTFRSVYDGALARFTPESVARCQAQLGSDLGLGRRAAPGREAALLHGHRRPRGRPRGDRARRGHVRLRPADPHRAHRQRPDVGRSPQPAQRRVRPRPAAARRGLHLPGVRPVH